MTSASPRNKRLGLLGASLAVAALGLTACGGSSGGAKKAAGSPSPSPSATMAPGAMFSVANVPGLGDVVVDARGRTVYILTSGGHHNVPCEDASGCTKYWPDLPLPDGTSTATAGSGVQASLLKSMKSSDGETYPTYNGWLMYEYVQDNGPGQANGQGIRSFGGTWYALTAAGDPVMSASSPSPSSGGGYGYGQ